MYGVSRVKFEIPGFGLAGFSPEGFGEILGKLAGMSRADIVDSIREDGWQLDVIANWRERDLTYVELAAIWGECNGYSVI